MCCEHSLLIAHNVSEIENLIERKSINVNVGCVQCNWIFDREEVGANWPTEPPSNTSIYPTACCSIDVWLNKNWTSARNHVNAIQMHCKYTKHLAGCAVDARFVDSVMHSRNGKETVAHECVWSAISWPNKYYYLYKLHKQNQKRLI